MAESVGDPFDMNSPNFNPDMFLQRTFKNCSLKEIMDVESEVVRDIATLHSDMQTLVYENYNKFISATETVRKMKSDFKQMEAEMNLLADNMNSITAFSEQISNTLQDNRSEISRLSSVHSLLKELQFLFKLPNNLKLQMEEGAYAQAVQDYLHVQPVLEQYGHMPSFQGIQGDIESTLSKLKQKLHDQIKESNANAQHLTESVDLLMKLHEPRIALCTEYLSHCKQKLENELNDIKNYNFQDVIEFVDAISNGFLSDLCLAVQSYNDMFLNRTYSQIEDEPDGTVEMKVNDFFSDNMKLYFEVVAEVLEKEQENGDTAVLARALDRFYRRLLAMNTLVQGTDFIELGARVIIRAGERQCKFYLHSLKSHFTDNLTRLRQSLATVKTGSQEEENTGNIPELLNSIILTTVEKIKSVLQDLLVFLQPDLTFGLNAKFHEEFCVDSIREGVVIGFLHHLKATARSFCSNQGVPSTLLLVLSKFCLEFQQTFVHHLLSQADEWFGIDKKSGAEILTSESEICSHMREAAQSLINAYVRSQGLNISQMLRKSVDTRDWLHTIEPRTVRAVMKRVIEDITVIETQVGLLYEEGQRSERSSDSSRKTGAYSLSQLSKHQAYRSNWSSYAPGQTSLAPNIHFQLFSERIDIFSSVEFSKVSILTGIIKISLKTLLECVRLRTFSRFGLQQIQVDTHYLQLHLWRFVSDEKVTVNICNWRTRSSMNEEIALKIARTSDTSKTLAKRPPELSAFKISKEHKNHYGDRMVNINVFPTAVTKILDLVHFLLYEILGSAVHRCLDPVLMEPSVVEIICDRG